MKLTLLTVSLLVMSSVAQAAQQCEIKRQYNETTKEVERVRICWNKDAPDWQLGSTVTEEIIKFNMPDCIYHYESEYQWSAERAAYHCVKLKERE